MCFETQNKFVIHFRINEAFIGIITSNSKLKIEWTFANCIAVKGNLLLNSRHMNLNLWHNLRRVDRFTSVKVFYSRWRYEKGHFMVNKNL